MKILALVTARGGSKRVPGKNLRLLGGRPLIAWSIDVAKAITDICDILMSTDDEQIAATARELDAYVPWLRPAELATDRASSVDVCLHALDWYETQHGKVDGLLLLQPTSPFRSRQTVLKGIELFRAAGRPVVAVSPAASHPLWCFRIEAGSLHPFVESAGLNLRSQDLPPAYVINGALYLTTPDRLRADRSFFYGELTQPLVVERAEEGLDIDTEWDFRLAQAVYAATNGELA